MAVSDRRPGARGRRAASILARLLILAQASVAWAQPSIPSDDEVLGPPSSGFAVESVSVRFAHFEQRGAGYQSPAGPLAGPGSEDLTVEQVQLEVIARQGERLTHRVWVPVDVVTAASPDAIDVVSSASRVNEAAGVDWTATYRGDRSASVSVLNGFHAEENLRSWSVGLGLARSFAEDNTTLELGAHHALDWLERYEPRAEVLGSVRSTLFLGAGVTQLLSPTTVAHADYGVSRQQGELGNTWSIVPPPRGRRARAEEILPGRRLRHALAGRVAQWLPWSGAVHGGYRLYLDDWGVAAHTVEVDLHQRLSPFSRLVLRYRGHLQDGVSFFETEASAGPSARTADSDLAPLTSHSVGVKGVIELPDAWSSRLRLDFGVERYVRSNDLRVIVYSCGLGIGL